MFTVKPTNGISERTDSAFLYFITFTPIFFFLVFFFFSDCPINVCAVRFSITLSSYDIGHHRLQGHRDGKKAIILPACIFILWPIQSWFKCAQVFLEYRVRPSYYLCLQPKRAVAWDWNILIFLICSAFPWEEFPAEDSTCDCIISVFHKHPLNVQYLFSASLTLSEVASRKSPSCWRTGPKLKPWSREMCRSGRRGVWVRAGRIMESRSSEFACIGLVVDNNSWRWSTDSSQRYTGRTSVSGGRFVFANQSKDHRVHTAGGKLDTCPSIRKVSLQPSL